MGIGNYPYGKQIIPFSGTPTFDCSMGNVFRMTLTGNITSMNVINAMDGHNITFIFIQGGLGLHSVTWPANFKGTIPIPITGLAGTAAVQEVVYDADADVFYAVAFGQVGL